MPGATVILPRLYGETAAAAYCGVSPATLRKHKLPRRVLGTRRLYERETLDEFIDSLPLEGEDEESVWDAALEVGR